MAVAFGTVATGTAQTGTDITITKPTSLAAGDLMVAILGVNVGTAHTASGWTEVVTQGLTTYQLTVLAKQADAGDAAASDFTFSIASGSEDHVGILFRITGTELTGAGNIASISEGIEADDTPAYATGVTTTANNDLLIMGCMVRGVEQLVSGQAVTTNDPTWTERADFTHNDTGDGRDMGLNAATATYATAGLTGIYSLTIAGAGGADSIGYLLSITETANVTVNLDLATAAATANEPTINADSNLTLDLATMAATANEPVITTAAAKWTDQTKNTTTWANQSKS